MRKCEKVIKVQAFKGVVSTMAGLDIIIVFYLVISVRYLVICCPAGCQCTGKIKPRVTCRNIRRVDLSKIPLSAVSLELQENAITNLDLFTRGPKLKRLETLDVSNNKIQTFKLDQVLTSMPGLIILNMRQNYVNSVLIQGRDGAQKPHHLRSLDLGINQLSHIGNVFSFCADLSSLHLDHNRIQDIHPEAFYGLFGLHLLYLNHNLLTMINSSLFRDTRLLRVLDLKNNRIAQIISSNAIHKWPQSLENLNLSHNKLSQIVSEPCVGRQLNPTVIHIDLQSNPTYCGCRWSSLHEVHPEKCKIMFNCITSTDYNMESKSYAFWVAYSNQKMCEPPQVTKFGLEKTRNGVVLICSTYGNPVPMVVIQGSDNFTDRQLPGSINVHQINVTKAATNVYTCTARNLVGSVSETYNYSGPDEVTEHNNTTLVTTYDGINHTEERTMIIVSTKIIRKGTTTHTPTDLQTSDKMVTVYFIVACTVFIGATTILSWVL